MNSPAAPHKPSVESHQTTGTQRPGKVFEVLGEITLDEMFSELEQRAKEGCVEHVTFDMVGVGSEDIRL